MADKAADSKIVESTNDSQSITTTEFNPISPINSGSNTAFSMQRLQLPSSIIYCICIYLDYKEIIQLLIPLNQYWHYTLQINPNSSAVLLWNTKSLIWTKPINSIEAVNNTNHYLKSLAVLTKGHLYSINLSKIEISIKLLIGLFPVLTTGFNKLIELNCGILDLRDSEIAELIKLQSLRTLRMDCIRHISSAGWELLGSMNSLNKLILRSANIYNSPFTTVNDISQLGRINSLTRLELYGCSLTNELIDGLVDGIINNPKLILKQLIISLWDSYGHTGGIQIQNPSAAIQSISKIHSLILLDLTEWESYEFTINDIQSISNNLLKLESLLLGGINYKQLTESLIELRNFIQLNEFQIQEIETPHLPILIQSIPNLTNLIINRSPLEDSDINNQLLVLSLKSLKLECNFTGNQLSNPIPLNAPLSMNLLELTLNECQFDGRNLDKFNSFRLLSILRITNNLEGWGSAAAAIRANPKLAELLIFQHLLLLNLPRLHTINLTKSNIVLIDSNRADSTVIKRLLINSLPNLIDCIGITITIKQ